MGGVAVAVAVVVVVAAAVDVAVLQFACGHCPCIGFE